MDSSKISALLLICMLFISSATPIFGCGSCGKPKPKRKGHKGKSPRGPITIPPIVKPPINLPPVIPPIVKPPITIPPIVKPPVTVPPITVPPVVTKPPKGGGLVHIGLGDPVVNECCPVLQGLVELEAAVCLCTTLKLKLLNLNIFVPLALQLLVTCGKTPPPGYTCSL
ncbi:hypothetical protein GH714_015097 [Hevea brasiliensis]|uniref:Bifunctional inhibitor/plant lipid transfer protein/seed storage helical domain-containing protein n=1 Tax=Hevea brasiliensis TaxID=3981 RepID=A0A6A6MA31_HEVBR|nr:hypothetical protein GH714_015097 [Hevea brasiliensis]